VNKEFQATKNANLKTATLKTIYTNSNDLKLGYLEWHLYKYQFQPSSELVKAIEKGNGVKSICSLQVNEDGSRVAVCRVHRDSIAPTKKQILAELKEALSYGSLL